MAYMKKTSLISRPVTSGLGDVWDTVKSGASSAIDFFGAGIKAQGGQEALAAQLAAQNAQLAAQAQAKSGGVSTTTLLIGGVALAGLLVFAMKRK